MHGLGELQRSSLTRSPVRAGVDQDEVRYQRSSVTDPKHAGSLRKFGIKTEVGLDHRTAGNLRQDPLGGMGTRAGLVGSGIDQVTERNARAENQPTSTARVGAARTYLGNGREQPRLARTAPSTKAANTIGINSRS